MGMASCSPRSAITSRIQDQSLTPSVPPTDRCLVLHGLLAALAGADAHGLFDVPYEHAAVAGLTGVGGAHDGVHGLVHDFVRHDGLDLELGQQRDVGPRAAV